MKFGLPRLSAVLLDGALARIAKISFEASTYLLSQVRQQSQRTLTGMAAVSPGLRRVVPSNGEQVLAAVTGVPVTGGRHRTGCGVKGVAPRGLLADNGHVGLPFFAMGGHFAPKLGPRGQLRRLVPNSAGDECSRILVKQQGIKLDVPFKAMGSARSFSA